MIGSYWQLSTPCSMLSCATEAFVWGTGDVWRIGPGHRPPHAFSEPGEVKGNASDWWWVRSQVE